MKRTLCCLLLMTCSMSWAEWEITSGAPEQVVYHDKTTKVRVGNIVKMWTMTDFPEAREDGFGDFLSIKTYDAFDCKKRFHALVQAFFYADKLATGNVIRSLKIKDAELDWLPIKPETVAEEELQIACEN
jgi:hypothetical protein